ncbi:MAG: tetratricopeptide repeat protein [Eubacteriales bacterium]
MSVTNTEVKHVRNAVSSGGRKRDYFKLWEASLLILLTVVISISSWYTVGKMYFWSGLDQKRVKQQLEFLSKKVEAEPKNLEYRVGLGYTYFLNGDNENATKQLNQVLEIDKNYYDGHYNLGLVLKDEGKLDDALEHFQKCVEISPKDYKGFLQKGVTYRKMKMYKEAVESLNRANLLMPGRADTIYEIGMVAEDKGDKTIAAGIYKEALRYDPMFKDALEALKRVQ